MNIGCIEDRRRNFLSCQGEKRRHSRGYGEASQRGEGEKGQVYTYINWCS